MRNWEIEKERDEPGKLKLMHQTQNQEENHLCSNHEHQGTLSAILILWLRKPSTLNTYSMLFFVSAVLCFNFGQSNTHVNVTVFLEFNVYAFDFCGMQEWYICYFVCFYCGERHRCQHYSTSGTYQTYQAWQIWQVYMVLPRVGWKVIKSVIN